MRKLLSIIAVGLVILAACSKKGENRSEEVADLSQEYQEATNFNDSLLLLMGDIYTGMDSINMQEGLLYQLQGPENANRREEIRQNLSSIKARLAANRELLNELEAKVNAQSQESEVLKRTITQLKERIAQQDAKIADLERSLAAANEQVAQVTSERDAAQEEARTQTVAREEAEQQAAEATAAATTAEANANAVYYFVGKSKELKQYGLNDPKKSYSDVSMFQKADKRNLTVIPLYTKKDPKFKSQQPPQGSYEIVKNADDTRSLRILNPDAFWRTTKYLVIEVK